MSVHAIAWAFDQQLKRASRKFVLVALANFASSECGTCYPSTKTLEDMTCMDRKTIIECLDDLERDGFIEDTKERKGTTKQVKVYKLLPSQKRNSSENGTIPLFQPKAPVFPVKDSQKRDTEPSGEPPNERTERAREEGLLKPDGLAIIGFLQLGLAEMYQRKPTDPWVCSEQFLLAEIARRPDAKTELAELRAARAKDPQYFPRSVTSLLEKWAPTLDSIKNPTYGNRSQSNQQRVNGNTNTLNAGSCAGYSAAAKRKLAEKNRALQDARRAQAGGNAVGGNGVSGGSGVA